MRIFQDFTNRKRWTSVDLGPQYTKEDQANDTEFDWPPKTAGLLTVFGTNGENKTTSCKTA